MNAIEIALTAEYAISDGVHAQLRTLLEACFPEFFAGRTHVKQLPHWRLLAMEGASVVGQLGIDVRVVNVGGTVVSIFGLLDVAVDSAQRGQGIASRLLKEAERIARAGDRDFLVLMADRHDLYLKAGYSRVQPALTKWLAIEDRQSIALIERDLSHCFMVKPLAERAWPAGTIDMLGYLF